MNTRTVTTQAEFDKAVADKVEWIDVKSPAGVWIDVAACGSSTVRACGNSTVRAYDNSTVTAYDNSTVRAYDNSTVTAYGNSTVRAYGNSTVAACGNSTVAACGNSTVRAYDNSTVTAYDNSTVRAYDNSTVRAYDNSTVAACGNSTVAACGNSTVRAYDNSTVTAYVDSTVRAYGSVAVHLHSATVNLKGGVVLDHTKDADMTAAEWCAHHGVKISRGIATVYKAVNDKWTTDRGTDYSPGSKPKCDDFRDTDDCGNGLHFGPTPFHALAYHREATKFVACGVRVSELRPITGDTAKCKAPRVVRACVEVDIDGNVIAEKAA